MQNVICKIDKFQKPSTENENNTLKNKTDSSKTNYQPTIREIKQNKKFVCGYLAWSLGDTRLLCPKEQDFKEGMANNCLYLDKADLQLLGNIDKNCSACNPKE